MNNKKQKKAFTKTRDVFSVKLKLKTKKIKIKKSSLKIGAFFLPKFRWKPKERKAFAECRAECVPRLFGRAKPNSDPDPHLLRKLDSDSIRIREKTVRSESDLVRSGSVATSAIDLTDNLIVCEQ